MEAPNKVAGRGLKLRKRLAFALCLIIGGGCAASSGGFPNPFAETKTPQQQATELEPMLLAAGFSELPASTADQDAKLKSLPPLKIGYYEDQSGTRHYWMADPDSCKCLFHGDETAYQRYQNIKLENQIAERDRRAVEMQQQPAMMGPGLGYGPYGGGPFGGSGIGFGGSGFTIGGSF